MVVTRALVSPDRQMQNHCRNTLCEDWCEQNSLKLTFKNSNTVTRAAIRSDKENNIVRQHDLIIVRHALNSRRHFAVGELTSGVLVVHEAAHAL